MGGGSYTFFGKLAVRAGGGYDASTGNGYVTFGASGISDIGAIDGGVRQDLTRSTAAGGGSQTRETIVGVSLRLFIPAAETLETQPDFPEAKPPVTSP
jgi:hypothetical protein